MKAYRLYIAVAISAACHAAMLVPGWSFMPASDTLRRGDNAVTLELVESVEAIARPALPAPKPVTQAERAIQRHVEQAAEQLASAMREISKIKLPEPPKPTLAEIKPPQPVMEPILQASRVQLDRSAEELAQCAKAVERAVELVKQRAAEQRAAEAAERARQAAMLAAAQPPAPKAPPKQIRPDGTSDVNSQASPTAHGEQGVTCGASVDGDLNPIYPEPCSSRNEEGVVALEWQVLPNGRCGWVKVTESSGNQSLDDAATEAVKKASYRPARVLGIAVESVVCRRFRFKMTDRR